MCCEPQAQYARMARDWWMKAGCQAKLEMHEVGAEELMASRLEAGEAGTYDFVFCDVGDRARYQACHEQIMQLLRVGGPQRAVVHDVAADEVLQHDAFPAMRQFNADLARDPRVVAMMVPLSYGITLCVKTVELDGGGCGALRRTVPREYGFSGGGPVHRKRLSEPSHALRAPS